MIEYRICPGLRLVRLSSSAWIVRGSKKTSWGILWGKPVWWLPRREGYEWGQFRGNCYGWGLVGFARIRKERDA